MDKNVLQISKLKHRLQGPELPSFLGDEMWYVFTPQMPPSLSELSSNSTTSNYVTDELWDCQQYLWNVLESEHGHWLYHVD
jgi:hypothetical protein